MKRILIAAVVLVLGVALSARVASAHPVLVTSTPEADGMLLTPPDQLVLVFSEELASAGTAVVALDPDGNDVEGEITIEGDRITVPLSYHGPGTYLVQWSAVSADDGGQTIGSFQYTVLEEPQN